MRGCAEQASPSTQPPPLPALADMGRCPEAPARAFSLPVWDLYVSEARWDALHVDVAAKVEVDALLCVDGRAHLIDLELQGASSRRALKKSFDVKMKRGVRLSAAPFGEPEERSRVLLKAMFHDPSLVREAVAFDLWRELGHAAPRTGFANLRINGAYWGLYALVEPVNDDYFERHGYAPDGQLYKAVRKHGGRADFVPGRNLYKAFENKTHESAPPPWSDLEALVELLQRTELSQAAFEQEIDPVFSLDAYFDRMLWVSLTQNGDAVAQNFFLYNAPNAEHDSFHLVPWDSNMCFGANWRDPDVVISTHRALLIDGGSHFGKRLMSVDGLRERYLSRYRHVLDQVLTQEVMQAALEQRSRQVAHDLGLDQERWQRATSPERAFAAIADFLAQRPAFVDEALHALELAHGDAAGADVHDDDLPNDQPDDDPDDDPDDPSDDPSDDPDEPAGSEHDDARLPAADGDA